MKKFIAAVCIALCAAWYAGVPSYADTTDFISTWKTDNVTTGSSDSNQIHLPLVWNGNYNFTVQWGDSSSSTITAWDQTDATHTYDASGTYTVTISGTIDGFAFQDSGDKAKLLDVSQWGSLKLGNSNGYFRGAVNFNISASDTPDLSETHDFGYAFAGATSFNSPINNWDMSQVTNLSSAFEGASSFNQPLNLWNVSHVVTMRATFYSARSFNQDISNWDVSRVWHFGIMFLGASSFNQNLANWDIASGGVAAGTTTALDGMLSSTGISPENYSAILVGWNTLTDTTPMYSNTPGVPSSVQFDVSAPYFGTSEVVAARNGLLAKGWKINDGGPLGKVGNSVSTTVSFKNDTNSDLTFSSLELSGFSKAEYSVQSRDCLNVPIASQASCTLDVVFTPAAEGVRLAAIRLIPVDYPNTLARTIYLSNAAVGDCSTHSFDGGDGSSGSPYLISTASQYACINAYSPSNGYLYMNSNFKLENDIDFSQPGSSFQEIGTYWNGFTGSLDGDGHKLLGIVDDSSWAGLIPWMTGNATVKNLTIKDATFISDWDAGAVCPWADTNGRIENVHVIGGSITTRRGWDVGVGGLLGLADHITIDNSSSSATINFTDGENDSHNANPIGGLIGQAQNGTAITRSYSTGPISFTRTSFDHGTVIGGLVGILANSTIDDSYTTSSVQSDSTNANTYIGSAVGSMQSATIRRIFATGATSGPGSAGFAGHYLSDSQVLDSFWNADTTNQTSDSPNSPDGVHMVSTAALKSIETFTNWNISNDQSTSTLWTLSSGDYPRINSTWDGTSVAQTPTPTTTPDPTPTTTPDPTPTTTPLVPSSSGEVSGGNSEDANAGTAELVIAGSGETVSPDQRQDETLQSTTVDSRPSETTSANETQQTTTEVSTNETGIPQSSGSTASSSEYQNPTSASTDPSVGSRELELTSMSVAALRQLPNAVIAKLGTNQFKILNITRLKALTGAQLAAIPVKAIAAIRPRVIAGLNIKKLKALTKVQVRSLTSAQLEAFTSQQRKALRK